MNRRTWPALRLAQERYAQKNIITMVNTRFLSILLVLTIYTLPIKAQTIRVAAVQMRAENNLDVSLDKAETFIRRAFKEGAELVILPESFTVQFTAVDYDSTVVEAVCPIDGEPLELLRNLAKEYEGVVGGSFLAYKSGNVFNSFVLVLPDGEYYVHNKDYPSFGEACYYTGGSDDGVFNTPMGRVGIALCWEIIRTETVRRMIGRVDIVLVASAWPGPDPEKNNENLESLKNSSKKFSQLLGVPVVHSNQVGRIDNVNMAAVQGLNFSYVGGSLITNSNGEVTKELNYQDGEGIIIDTISLANEPNPLIPIPDDFWIEDIGLNARKKWFESLVGPYREYYENTTRRKLLEKHLDQN